MSGITRIEQAFSTALASGRAAFMPYLPVGYPDIPTSIDLLETLALAGADLIEVGVPFSDPLADGPTVQAATQQALTHGVNSSICLEVVRQVRERGIEIPMLLMGYINPIMAYGIERYMADAAAAGADGLIIPDLPPDEAQEVEEASLKNGLAMVYLVAPTSTDDRLDLAAAHSSGFLYLVSVAGITGARNELPPQLAAFVERVRQRTDLPLAVGFGISTPEQASTVANIADGVIVGSALVKQAGSEEPIVAVDTLATTLAWATHGGDWRLEIKY